MEWHLKIVIPLRAGSFFDPAPPRCAAGKKLALTRSDSFPGGRSAAGAGGPEKISNARFRDPISKLHKDFMAV